ncbi:MAG: acetyltransferase [Verrucomicrobiota bacterium]
MFLKHVPTGDLVEVIDLPDVINPFSATIRARPHVGELIQRPENFLKSELVFLSGESLPLCWTDGHYREHVAA